MAQSMGEMQDRQYVLTVTLEYLVCCDYNGIVHRAIARAIEFNTDRTG